MNFKTKISLRNPKGNPFSWGAKYTAWENLRFLTEITVYLGNDTRQANGCYGTLTGSHKWRINLCRFRWPSVTLKGRTRSNFQAYLNNARKVWPRTTKFGRITHGVYFYEVTDAPTARWRGPNAPKFWGSLLFMYIPVVSKQQIPRGNTCGKSLVSWVSHASHPNRAEFQRSSILGVLLYLCLHPLTQNDHGCQRQLSFLFVSASSGRITR